MRGKAGTECHGSAQAVLCAPIRRYRLPGHHPREPRGLVRRGDAAGDRALDARGEPSHVGGGEEHGAWEEVGEIGRDVREMPGARSAAPGGAAESTRMLSRWAWRRVPSVGSTDSQRGLTMTRGEMAPSALRSSIVAGEPQPMCTTSRVDGARKSSARRSVRLIEQAESDEASETASGAGASPAKRGGGAAHASARANACMWQPPARRLQARRVGCKSIGAGTSELQK